MINKTCVVCNSKFSVHNYRANSAKYCSHACYSLSLKTGVTLLGHTCKICKKSFSTKYKNAEYCSVKCRNMSYEKPKIIKKCKRCGKEMRILPNEANRKKYCSRDCQANQVMLSCYICKKQFFRQFSNVRKINFCSPKCSYKYKSEFLSGKNSHQWKGGINFDGRYYKITHNKKRMRLHRYVMEQYLGRPLDASEVVHHIDGNRLNNSIDNLILFPTKSAHTSFHLQKK